MNEDLMKKNVPNWVPSDKDYRLIFREVDGLWIEVSNNLPKYYGMTFADYCNQVDMIIDYGCTFARFRRGNVDTCYRDCGGYLRIDVKEIEQ